MLNDMYSRAFLKSLYGNNHVANAAVDITCR